MVSFTVNRNVESKKNLNVGHFRLVSSIKEELNVLALASLIRGGLKDLEKLDGVKLKTVK